MRSKPSWKPIPDYAMIDDPDSIPETELMGMGAHYYHISTKQLVQLLNGKSIALESGEEYTVYLQYRPGDKCERRIVQIIK